MNRIFYTLAMGLFVAALAFFLPKTELSAQPAGFTDEVFIGGWNQAVGITFDPNGRMYVWEKSGKVWIVDNGVKLSNPLIDLSEEVGNWRDFGCLGFALDPNFLVNGYIYLFYVVDRHHLMNFGTPSYDPNTDEYFDATIGRITRYRVTPESGFTQVDYNSRFVLLGETPQTGCPILHQSHGTGHLTFGEDGTLIAMMGDGASYSSTDQGSANETYWDQALMDGIITPQENVGAYRVQMLDSYNGKLLRIDPVTGDGIPSNPYYNASSPRSARSRTYALGFRNSYRHDIVPNTGSHDPADGNPGVFIYGEVGWGGREELGVVQSAGQNFGWPKFEGMTIQPGYNNPTYEPAVHELPKIDWRNGTARVYVNGNIYNIGSNQFPGTSFRGNAGTGGVWYDGNDFPSEWKDTYFFGDYGGSGQWIRAVRFDANWNPVEIKPFVDNAGAVVFITTDRNQGSIYYVRYPNQVRKVSYNPTGNQEPIAVADATNTSGNSPLTIQFIGDRSYDPELTTLSYSWNFGDGSTSTDANPSHTFTASGNFTYNVTLTVTDQGGASGSTTIPVYLNNQAPQILSTSIDNKDFFDPAFGETINLSATVSDDSPTNQLTFAWQYFLFHNDHNHPEPIDYSQTSSAVLSPLDCGEGAVYWFRIRLTVTDPQGQSTVFEKDIHPSCPGLNQTVNFPAISDQALAASSISLNATASSGLPVVYYLLDGPVTIVGNTVNFLGTPGEVTIAAAQPGNGSYAPSLPVIRSFYINLTTSGPQAQSINFPSITNKFTTDGPFPVSASASSGLPVSLEIVSGPATINGNTITLTGAEGTVTVRATQDGNADYFAATPVERSFTVTTPAGLEDIDLELSIISSKNTLDIYTTVVFDIDLTNNGAGTAGDIEVNVPVPDGWAFTSDNAIDGDYNLADRTWSIPLLASGATARMQLTLFILQANNPSTIFTQVTAATGLDADSSPNNNSTQVPVEDDEAAVTLSPPGAGPQDQTINFPAIGDKDSDEVPFTVAASASSGLPVTLEIVSGPATIDGNTITLNGALGIVVVRATQGGNADYNPATPVEQSFQVVEPGLENQTITFPAIANKETTDAPFNVTATASSGLPVTLEIVSGPATIDGNTITLDGTSGTVLVRASQAGNAQYNPAQDVERSFAVSEPGANNIDLELSVTASQTELTLYTTVRFTISLINNGPQTAENITVNIPFPSAGAFSGSDATIGSYSAFTEVWTIASLGAGESGTATVDIFVLDDEAPLTIFSQVTQASPNDVDSTPDNNSSTVPVEDDEGVATVGAAGSGPQDQTINFPAIAGKFITDDPFTITAVASSGLPVSFDIVSGPATIDGNTITLDGTVGTVVVRATQAGNADFNAATPVDRSFTVAEPGLSDQTITFPSISNKATTDAPFTVSASASSGLPVTLDIISGPATIDGNTITLDGTPGTVVVRASQAGDASYNPALDVDRSFAVSEPGANNIDLELTVSSNKTELVIYQTVVYTITLSNVGNVDASNIVVSLNIPSGMAFTGATPSVGDYVGGTEWQVSSLNANTSATFEYELFVLDEDNAITFFTQVLAASPDDLDSTPDNNNSNVPNEDDEASVEVFAAGGGPTEPQDQTISFIPVSDKTTTDLPFTVSATATSGLPVSVNVVSGPATASGNTITLTGAAGDVILRYSQAGNANYNAAPDVFDNFTVETPTGPPAVVISSPAEGEVVVGNTVTVQYQLSGDLATAGADHLFLILDTETVDIHDLTGTYTFENVPAGPHILTAQLNDMNHNPLSNPEASYTINFSTAIDNGGGELPTGYCDALGTAPWTAWIDNVTFGNINNTSFKERYGDFTDQQTNVVAGNAYTVSLTPGYSWLQYDEYWSVWIDLNRDGDFEDPNELVFEQNGIGTVTGSVLIPIAASNGLTRMRVAMQRDEYASPCGSFENGEVEDYALNIFGGSAALGNQPNILDFIVASQQEQLNFHWSTNYNDQSDYFELQFSTNGNDFDPLMQTYQKPTGSHLGVYQETDLLPKEGAYFYRVKQVFQDGTSEFSNVRMLNFQENSQDLRMFPNPVQDKLILDVTKFYNLAAKVEIFNTQGQVVFVQDYAALPADLVELNLLGLTEGTYLLKLQLDNQVSISKKFLVKQ